MTHFFNFGHEGAPNVTKITYNMKILWENSPRKKNWGSFVHRGLRYEFLRKKIWTVPLILQFNINNFNFNEYSMNFGFLLSEHYQKTNIMKDENQENLVLVEFLTIMSELHLALSQNVFLKINFSKCIS